MTRPSSASLVVREAGGPLIIAAGATLGSLGAGLWIAASMGAASSAALRMVGAPLLRPREPKISPSCRNRLTRIRSVPELHGGMDLFLRADQPDRGHAGAAHGYADMGPFDGGQAEFLRVPYTDSICCGCRRAPSTRTASSCSPTSCPPAGRARWPALPQGRGRDGAATFGTPRARQIEACEANSHVRSTTESAPCDRALKTLPLCDCMGPLRARSSARVVVGPHRRIPVTATRLPSTPLGSAEKVEDDREQDRQDDRHEDHHETARGAADRTDLDGTHGSTQSPPRTWRPTRRDWLVVPSSVDQVSPSVTPPRGRDRQQVVVLMRPPAVRVAR